MQERIVPARHNRLTVHRFFLGPEHGKELLTRQTAPINDLQNPKHLAMKFL